MYQIDYCLSFDRFGGSARLLLFCRKVLYIEYLSIAFSVKYSALEAPLKLFWKLCCNFEPANVATLNKTRLNNKKIIIVHCIIFHCSFLFSTTRLHFLCERIFKERSQREKRDYVGKVPKRRTPSPHPPSLGIFTFFTVFFNIYVFAIL